MPLGPRLKKTKRTQKLQPLLNWAISLDSFLSYIACFTKQTQNIFSEASEFSVARNSKQSRNIAFSTKKQGLPKKQTQFHFLRSWVHGFLVIYAKQSQS
jgi:hypothetical protein